MTQKVYDTIIIGSGSIGTPLAWQLSEAGQNVLVIDQFASSGQGSNKEAIGGIRATHSDPVKLQLCLKSLEVFSSWKEKYGDDIGWKQGGYSFVAYRETEENTLKDLLVIQKKLGLEIDWYDSQDFLKIIPSLNPSGLLGGTFSPGDGSASPMLANLAMERLARAGGADFHFLEKFESLKAKGDKVIGVKTDKADYFAYMVVNAAGAWAKEILLELNISLPILPESHEGGITEPVAPFLGPMVVDIHPSENSANYYFYQNHTGQIIFCITPTPSIPGMDRRESSGFLPLVTRRMINLMPCLRNIKVRRTWRGLYPMTPDGQPIVGQLNGISGYLNAVGMCGQGFMLGPGLAVALRNWITGDDIESSTKLLAPYSLYRDFGGTEQLK